MLQSNNLLSTLMTEHSAHFRDADSQVFAEEVEPTGAVPMELSLERYRHAALQTSKAAMMTTSSNNNMGNSSGLAPSTGPNAANNGNVHTQHHQQHSLHSAYPSASSSYHQSHQQQSAFGGNQHPMPHNQQQHTTAAQAAPPHQVMSSGASSDADKRLQPRLLQNMFPGSGILRSDRLHLQTVLNGWYGVPKQPWRQIYRASVHGYAAADFHARCDGIAPTFVLVLGSRGEISGGFNDVAWAKTSHKGGYIHSERAFLFALGRSASVATSTATAGQPQQPDGPPIKYDIVKKPYAICYHAE